MENKKKVILVFLAIPLSILAQHLGVNIDLAERGGTFIDIVKEGYRWSPAGGGDGLTASQIDSAGWPAVDAQFVVDYRPVAEWSGSIDDPQTYRIDASGTYKCSFIGKADVSSGMSGSAVQNIVYDSSANTTTFEFVVAGPPGSNHGLFIISFTNTERTPGSPSGSGFSRFRMYRPGYGLNTTKTFTDEFIAALTGIRFSAIRFMDFLMTNGCDTVYPARTTWARRKLKSDASQDRIAPIGKTDGGAWEYIVELCNQVKMDPWITIPVSADSEYIVNTAKLFKDNLAQGLHIYVESSNEVWNTAEGFKKQSDYNQAEADALGIKDYENHARRTVQLAKIFSQVFGSESLKGRVRVVLCFHKPMLKWSVMPMLGYISRTFGPPRDYLYAIACQTYFGGGVAAGVSVDKILSNCHDNIAAQINETGGDEAGRVQWIKLAKDSGLAGGFCSYEGGPDHGGGSAVNIANRITAERDPRMGQLWTYNLDTAFFQVGGNLAMQFTLSGAYTRYGCWGLTDDITKPDRNSKYKAAQQLALRYPSDGISAPRAIYAAGKARVFEAIGTKEGIKIAYSLIRPDDVRIAIWSIKGQLIRQWTLPHQSAGEHVFIVNEQTHLGKRLANSYCIATIATGPKTERCGFVFLPK